MAHAAMLYDSSQQQLTLELPFWLQGKRRRSEAGKEEGRRWSAAELKSLEERLIALGAGRTAELQ